MFDALLSDVRFASRMLRKHVWLSVTSIATLALAIGANTAIFSVLDAVVLRPLSYPAPERLVTIHEVVPQFSRIAPLLPVNAMHFREWRRQAHSFERLALVGGVMLNLTGGGEPERIAAARVSPGLFPMLGVRTRLGRTFLEEEDQVGRDRVVVLNYDLWKRRFAADPNIVGRKIVLDGDAYEVVGVLPEGFRFPKLSHLYAMNVAEERPQLWKPFAVQKRELAEMGDFNFVCIGRLKPGIAAAQAAAELNAVQSHLVKDAAFKVELRAALVPLGDQIASRSRSGLVLLMAAVGVVLLIGCVNIANLLLARASGRRREIAIRSALGAGRGRIVRQMLVESLLLALAGGAAGVAVAHGVLRVLVAYVPADLPRLDEVQLDGRVLAFTLALALLTGLLFGLLPALRLARSDPQETMRFGARGATAGRTGGRLRSLLIGFETGLSALCLVAGGLLLHSFVKLLELDRGFATERIVTMDLRLPANRYPALDRRVAFIRSLLEKMRALPGAASAGIVNKLPLSGEGSNNLIAVEGTTVPIMERPLADIRNVNPGYFRTMGIPLRSGRVFDEADGARRVAVVSALMAERVWPGQNPVGKRFRIGADDSPLVEVAGVVGDVRGVSLNRRPMMTAYVPYWQQARGDVSLVVRTAMAPLGAASAIRKAIREIDPELPVPAFRTMHEIVTGSLGERRFQMNIVLLFGAAALLLAGLGTYSSISYAVAQRTNEMGIRIALGAGRGSILLLVLRQGLLPVAAGLACGVAASAGLGRILGSMLFGVGKWDPATACGVVILLAAVAAAAIYIPARRATRIDPMTALHYE